MSHYISMFLIGGGFFLAVITLLAVGPKWSRRLTTGAAIFALAGGILAFGYGCITTLESLPLAILKTIFCVCRMFIGEVDLDEVSASALYGHTWFQMFFWAVAVTAFYATSSAAISVIGASALRNLRLRFSRRQNLNILYGVSEDTLEFGQALLERDGELLVYVSEDAESQAETIAESGCVLRSDAGALGGDAHFLKSLGVGRGNRQITVYALHSDSVSNVEYARNLLEAFRQRGVEAKNLTLVIHAREDEAVMRLQFSRDRYGYGFVSVFQEPVLAGRMLVQKYPPCHSVSFDESCRAQEDFEVLVIGFGQLGQTVLRNVLMNGQFVGSRFRADVFAPDPEETTGFFCHTYKGIFDNYEVNFHNHDGRSRALYEHLEARLDSLRYIVVCTGSEEGNAEIGEELRAFLQHRGKVLPVHLCSYRGIQTTDPVTMETESFKLYHPDVLATRKLDRMAMAVNRYYRGDSSNGALSDWMECDYFSRMSSRAFADSLEAVLRAAGKTPEQAKEGQWSFTPEQMENLGIMEHCRWNAFHFCMGFAPMSHREYEERTQIYLREKAEFGKGKIRIGKNLPGKTHACLIPWEALDALSEKENSITGGSVDYKQMDISNVMILPDLLKIAEEN